MTENRTRAVEEPAGYDHTPTDRIPVPGDLSDERTDGTPRDAVVPAPAMPVEPDEAQAFTPEPVTGTGKDETERDVFDDAATERFRDRWRELQAGFVDDPAQAVRGADELVDEMMRELAQRRERLQSRWRDGAGGAADTEELRVVIREYRAFFDRLLNA